MLLLFSLLSELLLSSLSFLELTVPILTTQRQPKFEILFLPVNFQRMQEGNPKGVLYLYRISTVTFYDINLHSATGNWQVTNISSKAVIF